LCAHACAYVASSAFSFCVLPCEHPAIVGSFRIINSMRCSYTFARSHACYTNVWLLFLHGLYALSACIFHSIFKSCHVPSPSNTYWCKRQECAYRSRYSLHSGATLHHIILLNFRVGLWYSTPYHRGRDQDSILHHLFDKDACIHNTTCYMCACVRACVFLIIESCFILCMYACIVFEMHSF
jgi:hypothetical protein